MRDTEVISLADIGELPEITKVYSMARIFMAANGNHSQWGMRRYPPEEVIREDILLSRLYLLKRGGRIAAAFVLFLGCEPTYEVIKDGAWPNDKPYMTIHRLASRPDEHGCGRAVIEFAKARCIEMGLDLRADTHADNKPVQHLLLKNGFEYCGVIRVKNGSERFAYQLRLGQRGD